MTDAKRQNPLLVGEYGTPHNTAPFDQITLADYEEAIMEGMRLEEAAIKEITENPEEPTFENTILPPTDELLNRATTIFFNLLSCCTSDDADRLRRSSRRCSPSIPTRFCSTRSSSNASATSRNMLPDSLPKSRRCWTVPSTDSSAEVPAWAMKTRRSSPACVWNSRD